MFGISGWDANKTHRYLNIFPHIAQHWARCGKNTDSQHVSGSLCQSKTLKASTASHEPALQSLEQQN